MHRWLTSDVPLRLAFALTLAVAAGSSGLAQTPQPWSGADVLKVKTVGEVHISPDGTRIAYTIQSNNRTGRPASQVWIWDRAATTTARLGGDRDSGTNVRWSPDSKSLAFTGRVDDESGLMVQRLDGSPALALGRVLSTNHPLPSTGSLLTWSPGSSRVAIANGVPGPEGAEADGDPMVITRYLFKPGASEGLTRFNDNRRLQIQMIDLVSHDPRPLTNDTYYNHSLEWSPRGDEVLFVSNREADPDRVFNYDVFAVNIARATIRRITNTATPPAIVAAHDYDPFGSEATSPSQDGERMKWTGHERDQQGTPTVQTDDLDYLHARYEHFTIARFVSLDPVRGDRTRPQSFNLYAYVGNNPINYVDPLGLLANRARPVWDGGSIVVHAEDPCPWMPSGMPCDMESWLDFVRWSEQHGVTPGTPEYASAVLGGAGLIASPVAEGAEYLAGGFDTATGWVSAADSLILRGDPTATGVLVFLALTPGPFDNAFGAAVRRYNPQQQALLALTKEVARKGVTMQEAAILREWALEYGVPFRGPQIHSHRAFKGSHIHLGPYNHIPVR